MLILFVLVEAMILVLDLLDFRVTRRRAQRSSTAAVGFLFVVMVVFLLIQISGSSLIPNASQILESLRKLVGAITPLLDCVWASLWRAEGNACGFSVFYTAGFWDYLVHRTFSHSRWFWFTHEYHHLPRQVSVVMPGILVRPFAFIPVFLTTLATGVTVFDVLGMRPTDWWDVKPVIPVLLLIVVIQTASHSRFLRRRWCVHRWLQLPFSDNSSGAYLAPRGGFARQLWHFHHSLGQSLRNVC